MGQDLHQVLRDFKKNKDFFIGIDSDGCAFDTMEIEHKECFCPNTIKYWNLQVVSKYARDAWDYVNLYSKFRGCNRFIALIEVMNLLRKRKEVINRKAGIPDLSPIVEWTKKETKLGNPALTGYAKTTKNPTIEKALAWSIAINKDIESMVHDIPPFPFMRESLEKMVKTADIIVVSQTPGEALEREWKENKIERYAGIICGQEYGTKKEHLKFAAKGKYDDKKILMIGDAPGDYEAARANGVLFYPINPGYEDASWERFFKEALDKFFSGTYAGAYEEGLIKEFDSFLPSTPPWEK
jgi:phosphoglycolate phosphatase-like HAD superfamily hydrolase